MQKKAVVLHSGGLDSTVLIYKALEEKRDVLSLGIDYGQTHRIELEYALHQCKKLKIPRNVIKLEWHKPSRIMPLDRQPEEIRSGISTAFLPGRNVVFLSIACAEASGIGAEEVWIGVNSIDFSGYPDCTPQFIDIFREMLSVAIPNGPKIINPLQQLSKLEIVEEAKRLGIRPNDTWSCYRPNFSEAGIIPCTRCDACKLHDYAWQAK